METKLVNYGIQNEKSDIRIHVCPKIRRVYLYETQRGVDAISTGVYQQKSAGQTVNGRYVITASGYVVPIYAIAGCQELALIESIWAKNPILETDSTTRKGQIAVEIVRLGLIQQHIKLPTQATIIDEKDLQIEGVDIIVRCQLRLQIKCDFRGGDRALGGTGNLYLQTAESNPLKAI